MEGGVPWSDGSILGLVLASAFVADQGKEGTAR